MFVHSFNKYVLFMNYVPGTVEIFRQTGVNAMAFKSLSKVTDVKMNDQS